MLSANIEAYESQKINKKSNIEADVISALTAKVIKLSKYLDLKIIIKTIALNDFDPKITKTLFANCQICKDKSIIPAILYNILSEIDIDKNLANIKILLERCFKKFNISLEYRHLYRLHNLNLKNYVLKNFLGEPKDDFF